MRLRVVLCLVEIIDHNIMIKIIIKGMRNLVTLLQCALIRLSYFCHWGLHWYVDACRSAMNAWLSGPGWHPSSAWSACTKRRTKISGFLYLHLSAASIESEFVWIKCYLQHVMNCLQMWPAEVGAPYKYPASYLDDSFVAWVIAGP